MKQYVALKNITIGNGKGMHKFSTNQSYTDKALALCGLTRSQIRAYFSTDKGAKK